MRNSISYLHALNLIKAAMNMQNLSEIFTTDEGVIEAGQGIFL